jgi:hypothetical protein
MWLIGGGENLFFLFVGLILYSDYYQFDTLSMVFFDRKKIECVNFSWQVFLYIKNYYDASNKII